MTIEQITWWVMEISYSIVHVRGTVGWVVVTCLFYWEYLCFYTVPQGATDKFSDFVGFIMSYRGLCGFHDSPFSLLASFCVLAGTGNSTITLRYDILEQNNCFFLAPKWRCGKFSSFLWNSDNRPYSYSRYWTGTSLQLRLMRGVFSNTKDFYLFLMIFPRMSLHCKLVPVQYREYEYGLFRRSSRKLKVALMKFNIRWREDVILKKTNKRIETSRTLALQKNRDSETPSYKKRDCETHITAKKRDCETREIRVKFCETQSFWRTIRHP